jgi:hypothetical protein
MALGYAQTHFKLIPRHDLNVQVMETVMLMHKHILSPVLQIVTAKGTVVQKCEFWG